MDQIILDRHAEEAGKHSRSQAQLMRIAQQSGSNKNPWRGVTLLMVLLLIGSLGTLRAQEQDGVVEVSAALVEASGDFVTVDLALSRPASVRTFILTSPDRVVYDIENSVLVFDSGSDTLWSSPMPGVSRLEISQFSLEPPVVRIVAEITDLALNSDRESTEDGLRLLIYRGSNPFEQIGSGVPPGNLIPTIESFWHETLTDGTDRFTVDFSFGVVLPQIRIESPTVLLLRFPGTDILLPASNPSNFGTSVDGNIVNRMRAELLMLSTGVETEIRLTVLDTSVLGYTLDTTADDNLQLVLFEESVPQSVPEPIQEPPVLEPLSTEGDQIMVLSSSGDIPTPSDARTMVSRVQFQKIDSETDRFYLYYEGGEIEPRINRYSYPTRITVFIPDTSVMLPDDADGRFQTAVEGALADEMKVFNRVIEGVGPECQLVFYFPTLEQESIGYTIDYVDEGEMHVDFYLTQAPVNTEIPVEVNMSIGEPEIAPAPIQESQPEIIEEPEVIEESVPEIVERSDGELPIIRIISGEVIGDDILFHITTSEQLPVPEIIEYRYPDRIGLRFPLADVEVLDAGEGVYTTYTHIRSIPIVRAIIKDRADEHHTTLTFTLGGSFEEYEPEVAWNGTEITAIFHYTPMLAGIGESEVPELVEEPVVIEPVEIEEIEVIEPEIIEAPEPVEEPGAPTGPGEPPFGEPGMLPTIVVSVDEITADTFRFRFTTSEEVPDPEWIQYRYPDRLGLRFPISEIELLDAEPGVYTAFTHIREIPLVRAITKDRDDEQHTTVAFTLEGSLEDYESSLQRNGNEILVAFVYRPLPDEIEEPAPAIEFPVVAEPVIKEEQDFEFTPEPEPVMIAEVEVEEAEEYVPQRVEEYTVVEVSAETGDRDESFEGVVISGFSFSHDGDADILRLSIDGELADWEILPVNFPTKLLVRIPNSSPLFPNGDSQRYDETVNGSLVTDLTVTSTAMFDTSYTILSLYTEGVESTELLAYDVNAGEGVWELAVFSRGQASPFGETQPIVRIEDHAEPVMPMPPIEDLSIMLTPVRVTDEDLDQAIEVADTEDAGPRLTMKLDNADIRDVIQLIAEQAGLNIMINQEVRGTITISLTDVPLFDTLDLLGAQMGFSYVVQAGVYIFGDPLMLQEQFIFWNTWFVRLSYSVPDQVKRIITGLGIMGSDQIHVYQGTRSLNSLDLADRVLILQGQDRDLERAYRVIAAIDQPPVMVQVDFLILSTSLTDNENLGFEFDISTGGNTGMTALTFLEKIPSDGEGGWVPQGFDRPITPGSPNQWSINYTINYLIEEGYAEILNRSTLTVANNQQGMLRVGETVPYRSTFQVSDLGRVTQRVDQQQLGLTLRFTAHANPDDSVSITMTPENRNLLELTDVGPRTIDQSFSTTVRTANHEPFIVGGFIREEERVNYDRFPLLGDLPLLGHLFRSREIQRVKSEMVFVFTPHIIRPGPHMPEILTAEDFGVPAELSGRRY